MNRRSRHFSIDFEYFKQAVQLGEVDARFVSGENNWADYLTKHLPGPRFSVLREESLGQQEIFRDIPVVTVRSPFVPRSHPFRREIQSTSAAFQSSFEGYMSRNRRTSEEDLETTGG